VTFYGALQIGRQVLTEFPDVSGKSSSGARTVSVAGMEATPPLASQAAVRDRAEALLAMDDAVVPVTWEDKPHLDGWFTVSAPSVDEQSLGTFTSCRWKADLVRVGADSEVEIESRLTGGSRLHASSATPERWHAAPTGHTGYYVGTSTPGSVTRSCEGGSLVVYRAIPAGANPRWAATPTVYRIGQASVTVGGSLRTGTTCPDAPTDWAVSNGLVKVEPRTSTGTLRVTSWLGSAWGTPKVFAVKRGTTPLGAASHVTILRNDPAEVVVRLSWDHSPGRTTIDLTLKRGSRFIGVYVQQYEASSALRVDDNGGGGTVTDQLTAAGYIATTSDDADGNRWILGATVSSTAAGTFGLAANVAALGLACFIGVIHGGASPASGDAAADVNAQYLGSAVETERVILR